jgi:hypothetical protein
VLFGGVPGVLGSDFGCYLRGVLGSDLGGDFGWMLGGMHGGMPGGMHRGMPGGFLKPIFKKSCSRSVFTVTIFRTQLSGGGNCFPTERREF